MTHNINQASNGKTITVKQGDNLSLCLNYVQGETHPMTAWTFGDNFSFNSHLALGTMEVGGGVRRMEFTAIKPGTVTIQLREYYVLGIDGPSNTRQVFTLSVNIS